MKIRIKYSKVGPLKFIGHLDIMRYFQKAIRRADIDIMYSNGFSPHQILSFAAPLGVGMESVGEYFDIEVNSATSSDDMIKRLNHEMAEGIKILSVVLLNDDAINGMASVSAAEYQIKPTKCWPKENMSELVSQFLSTDCIEYEKTTKTGTHIIDLRPGLYDMHFNSESLLITVDASSSGNIKPRVILSLFLSFCECEYNAYDYNVCRMEVYTKNPESKQLIPLENVGKVFDFNL